VNGKGSSRTEPLPAKGQHATFRDPQSGHCGIDGAYTDPFRLLRTQAESDNTQSRARQGRSPVAAKIVPGRPRLAAVAGSHISGANPTGRPGRAASARSSGQGRGWVCKPSYPPPRSIVGLSTSYRHIPFNPPEPRLRCRRHNPAASRRLAGKSVSVLPIINTDLAHHVNLHHLLHLARGAARPFQRGEPRRQVIARGIPHLVEHSRKPFVANLFNRECKAWQGMMRSNLGGAFQQDTTEAPP
jgi:hypothetical protein